MAVANHWDFSLGTTSLGAWNLTDNSVFLGMFVVPRTSKHQYPDYLQVSSLQKADVVSLSTMFCPVTVLTIKVGL